MRSFMRGLAIPIAILIAASELDCVSTSVSMASSFNDEKEGIHAITSIEQLSDDIAYQKLSVGATEADIIFPDTLTITVKNIDEKKVESTGSSENEAGSDASQSQASTESSESEATIETSQNEADTESSEAEKEVIEETGDVESGTANTTENTSDSTTQNPEQTETEEKQSETTESEEDTDNANNVAEDQSKLHFENNNFLSEIYGLFKPLTVYASDNVALDGSSSESAVAGYATSGSETIVTTEELILENLTWKIDSSKSTSSTFTSEEAGAKFVYVPSIPYVFNVDTDLPTITVEIVAKEVTLEYMTLEKDGVKVEGNLPVGSELVVSVISDDEAQSLLDTDGMEVICAYDISIVADGEEVALDESVKVTITPPSEVDVEAIDSTSLELIHVTEDMTNEVLDVDITSEGNIEFEADGFSPYILATTEYEIEAASGKTFSQSVRVSFSDASLIDAETDTITLTLYGNISSQATETSDGTITSEPIQLAQETVSITSYTSSGTSSTAYVDYTFSDIPVYINAGTGDATAGGTGAYTMPDDFYGIQIETVSGYTPSGGTGDSYVTLSPVKDSNDAAWTTSQITITNTIMELASPSFTIEWQDNRNYAGMRPYSTSYTLDDADAVADKILLYYNNGSEYVYVGDDSDIIVSSGSNHPTVSMSSFSNWNVSFKGLPKYVSGENEYDWYIKLDDEFFNDGTDKSAYYNISGLNADGYLPISETTTNTLELTYSDEITGTITWRVGSSSTIPTIPSDGELFTDAGMTFYSQTGSDSAVLVTSSYEIVWENTDTNAWTYTISGLPLYASSGDAIVYYIVMEPESGTYTDTTGTYKFTYDNGDTSTDTDKCYSGQNIYATIIGDAEFSFDKVWYDDNDDDSIDRRALAIEKGITLYLWRYPGNKTQADGAPVTTNAQQYTYTFTADDAKSQTKTLSFSDFSDDSTTFAKYDEMGYEYIYYVTEVSESELYATYYYNGNEEYSGESTHEYVLDGGKICNARSAEIAVKATKYWNVSAVADYVSSECTLVLQKKTDDGWIDLATLTLTGFSSSKKKVTGAFDAQKLYDGLGKRYEFRVVERTITTASGVETTISDDNYTADSDDIYTAAYELNDYSYKVTSEYTVTMTDGVESASCLLTNKLYGTKDLSIIKTWSGDGWGIGTDTDYTGDVTLTLYRAVDGETASEYATIVLAKPASSAESGTFTITYLDTEISATHEYTISDDGAKWTTEDIQVPAYTDDGVQYVYSITENSVATTGITYGKEYDKTTTGKEIKLYVNNYTGGKTYMTRIDVSKVWKDDSDVSQRSDVLVEFGYYDSDGTFNAVTNSGSASNEAYTLVLSSSKDYENYLWIHGEDFMITEDEKSAYEAATSEEKATLRAEAIANHLSIRASLYNEVTGSYDRAIENATIDDNGNLTGGTIPAVVDATNSYYRPGYTVTVTKSSDGSDFAITNTRFAQRSFTFTKNWTDSDNVLGLRGDFLRVALFREIGETEEEVAYIDIPTYSDADKTTLTSGDALTVTFTNGVSYYPAYDDSGDTYSYSIKEYICTGDAVTTETLCTDGAENDTPDSRVEIDVDATKDTTTTGYVVTQEATSDTAYENTTYNSVTSLLMTDSYGYTNQASGERSEVSFYVIWHDYAKSDQRPDLYYTLYYYDSGSGSLSKYEGSYTEKWESVVTGNKYIQKVAYTGLPTADDNGNVYIYYVAETLNNAASTYEIGHYTAALYDGDSFDTNIVENVTVGSDTQFKILDDSSKDTYALTEDPSVYLTKEGSFTLISIADTVKVEGKKLWTNVPEGILADNLPVASIYLFRESAYDTTNAAPTVDASATTTTKKDAYAASAVPEISSGDGSASPRSLNSEKSLYAFGTYDDDGTVASYAQFPKYDELGYQYTYSVKEIIYNTFGSEIPSGIMQPSYSDSSADLTNVYQISSTTNLRNFEITKQWNITKKDYQEVYAKATFRLYRMELASDGDTYNALLYAADDTSSSEVASSAYAASVFDIYSAELVDEQTVTTDGTETTSTITWENYPIFAPSGKIYGYFAVEMTADMPGYTSALNGADTTNTSAEGSGATSGNTLVSGGSGDDTYIGVAFANNGISLTQTANENEKTECFINTYNTGSFDTITFYKEWDSTDNEGSTLKPGIDDALAALSIALKATAVTQSGKDNAETITFTEDTDYTLSVENVENDNTWKYTITFTSSAPVYSVNGNPYTYTVTETLNSDFVKTNYKTVTSTISASASGVSGTDLTIGTNLKNSLKGGFTVQKRWDDYSNDYGMREGSVFFKVYYRLGDSGTWISYNNGNTYELNSSNSWKYSFTGLPVSANSSGSNGDYYQYRVVETSIVQTDGDTTTTIDVAEPSSSDAQTTTWTQNGTSTTDSDYFYETVSAGNYLVYNPADITDVSSSPTVKIVNQLDSENAVTSLTVTKVWDDNSDYYGLRPSSITVMIQKSNDEGSTWTDVATRTITSSAVSSEDSNTWAKTFENLPKYYGTSANDETYMYRAIETKVGSATATIEDDLSGTGGSYAISHVVSGDSSAYEVKITNTLRTKNEAISVALRWNDEADTHDDITVALYSANFTGGTASSGVVTDETTLTRLSFAVNVQTLTDSSSSYTYSGLPMYNEDGELIIYYVKEETTGDFKTQYVSDTDDWPVAASETEDALQHNASEGADSSLYVYVINTPLISIEGSKVWADSENAFGLRPDSLTLTLQRTEVGSDGTASDDATWENVSVTELEKTSSSHSDVIEGTDGEVTITVSDANNWTATITSLPLYALGDCTTVQRYRYRLSESSVPNGYEVTGYTYGGDLETETAQISAVTNTLLTREAITVEKTWNAADSEKTSVTVTLYSTNFTNGEDSSTAELEVVTNNGQEYVRTISSEDSWETVFEDLPSTNMDGYIIVYYVLEEAGDGYFTTYYVQSGASYVELSSENEVKTDGTSKATFRILNTPYTNAKATVEWTDAENSFATRPDSVYVKLQRRAENADEYEDVVWSDIPDNTTSVEKIAAGSGSDKVIELLDTSNSWTVQYEKLPLYVKNVDGSAVRYEYRFLETDSSGNAIVPIGYSLISAASEYVATNDGTEAGYTNSYDSGAYETTITNTLITKEITVVKVWDDDSNAMSRRPDKLILYITEDTSVSGSTGGFNSLALGGVSENSPYGQKPVSNENANLEVSLSTSSDGNTWTYNIAGLPRYAYGDGVSTSSPAEITYIVTEDTSVSYSGMVLADYYSTEYSVDGDTTTITNTAVASEGVLIIEKDIKKRTDDETITTYAFPFEVYLTQPGGTKIAFVGTYYLYDKDEIANLSAADLREDAFAENSEYERTKHTAANGKIYISSGKVAVLMDITTGCTYEVTESPSSAGYEVYSITNNSESCEVSYENGKAVVSGGSDNTTVKENSSTGELYAYASGTITGLDSDPCSVEVTNQILDLSLHYLGIENVTEVVTDSDGNEVTGGFVKTYKSYTVVDGEENKVGEDDYEYVDTQTPYIEEALSIEFTPDTDLGYTYSDSLTICYWESGDDFTSEAPHKIVISGYVYTDSDGNQVPYTGTLIKNDDGTITLQDGSEEFLEIWSPLLASGTPYNNVKVLEGSVVITLATSVSDMPAVTLVQVSFVPPESTPNNGTPSKTTSTDDDDDSSTEDSNNGETTESTGITKGITALISEDIMNLMVDSSKLKGVRTGDETPIYLLAALFAFFTAAAGVVSVLLYRTKRKDKK